MSEAKPTVAEMTAKIFQFSRELGERAERLVRERKAQQSSPAIDALERASAELARTGMVLERYVRPARIE